MVFTVKCGKLLKTSLTAQSNTDCQLNCAVRFQLLFRFTFCQINFVYRHKERSYQKTNRVKKESERLSQKKYCRGSKGGVSHGFFFRSLFHRIYKELVT